MQVAKWRNVLVVPLPRTVIEELELKEGDEIEIVVTGKRQLGIARDDRRKGRSSDYARSSVPFQRISSMIAMKQTNANAVVGESYAVPLRLRAASFTASMISR